VGVLEEDTNGFGRPVMSDLDSYRTQQDAHRGRTARTAPTRYSEAINRYLGAAGYRLDEPDLPATTADRPVPPAATTTGVLVGVDDTPTSYTAVDHAAIEAGLRGWDLRIIHVQHPGGLRQSARDAGARLLERLTDRVHAYSPSVPVTCRLMVGSAAHLLLSGAEDAGLVVVGHRHGAVGATFGLSVGDRVAAQHHGAVLVVRVPGWPPGPEFGSRPVVVGADRAESPAVRFALEEARVRGCDLVMLRAGDGLPQVPRPDLIGGVRVHHTDIATDPVSALLDASSTAAAIVVGRRGTGGLGGASLGSVSRTLVQRAHCPIFLVG
jgi:nucleotide-binding universal stress UspA family protein